MEGEDSPARLGSATQVDAKESEVSRLSRLLDEQSKLLSSLEDRLGFVTSPEPREGHNAPIQESLHITVLNQRLQDNNLHIKYLRNILVV